jgi:N-acetylneuraminic acid mutarotase
MDRHHLLVCIILLLIFNKYIVTNFYLGQVSVFGGYNNSGLYLFGGQINSANGSKAESSSLYLFNTTTYNWTDIPQTAGSWPLARDSASAIAAVSTGTSYMFGGEPQTTGSTWLYNSTWCLQYGNTWSQIGGIAPGGGRQSHGVAMLSDGRMVILGGADHLGNAFPLSSILIFHTNTQQYTVRVRLSALVSCIRHGTNLLPPHTTSRM